MMHTFVGFLRLANFICAATVLFGLITEKLITLELEKDNPEFLKDISQLPLFKEVNILLSVTSLNNIKLL